MRFLHFDHVGSTQDVVKEFVEKGEFGPLWVRASSQGAGRGRQGRVWVSKTGNLYASGLYPWTGPVRDKPLMSFVTANALAETLSEFIDPSLIRLKWPNDVLVNKAKIAGILLEAGDGWLSMGVGLNLEHHPEGLPYPVTHLSAHLPSNKTHPIDAHLINAESILSLLVENIDLGMRELASEGFVPTRRTWLARASRLGEEISVRVGEETLTGIFETIGESGALRLRLESGIIRDVIAGDVLL